uniref:Uncharacterized protein n=1 Tax=Biomphalaria glabrata TaxID=6526 RepID=A0A2C9L9A6_BIOGL
MGKEYLISTPAIVSSSGAKQVSSITMYLVTYVPPIQLSFLVHWTPQGKNKKIPNYVIASKVYTIVVDPIYWVQLFWIGCEPYGTWRPPHGDIRPVTCSWLGQGILRCDNGVQILHHHHR